jgi:hypothetical protein
MKKLEDCEHKNIKILATIETKTKLIAIDFICLDCKAEGRKLKSEK